MLSVSDLSKDDIILLDGAPHRVLELHHKKIARQAATVDAKLKNLLSGNTASRTFSSSDKFEEAKVEKRELQFEYSNRGKYVFVNPEDKSERYELMEDDLGEERDFLKEGLSISAHFFKGEIINIELPIKVNYKVVEAPPNIRGNTVSGGTKQVKIESGATINTPLFIEIGDIIRVNTEKGEYTERVKKSE
ncbi:MAG: elongation factor P [Candidatus Spechtbacterales bacterium]|nr:elongation factor P [Candidatus Spechtbacterales bacterium]